MNKLLVAFALLCIPSIYGMDQDEEGFENTHTLSSADPNRNKKWQLMRKWNVGSKPFTITHEARVSVTKYAKSEDDDEPVGVVTLAIKDPNLFEACCWGEKQKAYIDIVAVAPMSRRQGIARKLVNDLLDEIQHDPHIGEVVALVKRDHVKHDQADSACLKHDFPAIQLFQKLGFKEQPTPDWAPRKFTYSFDIQRQPHTKED